MAKKIYKEMNLLKEEGARKEKQLELNKVLSEITSYGRAPYFLNNHIIKLISDAKFDEARILNSLRLDVVNHQRLGAKEQNVIITPEVASSKILIAESRFEENLDKEREMHEYRTGQSSGKFNYYADLVKRMTQNIQVRTENYRNEIASEMQRMQPPMGQCFRYFRNTPKCVAESAERIRKLQLSLQQYNSIDRERGKVYAVEAEKWRDLEEQGRRYVATQNGEDISMERRVDILTPEEDNTTLDPNDKASPEERLSPHYIEGIQCHCSRNLRSNYRFPSTFNP
jgi:hypothetical protein